MSCHEIVVFTLTIFKLSKCCNGSFTCTLLPVLAKARICRLVQHKVGCLNVDKVGQEWEEEGREDHRHDEGEIEHDLSCSHIAQDNEWQKAGSLSAGQNILRNTIVNIPDAHHND